MGESKKMKIIHSSQFHTLLSQAKNHSSFNSYISINHREYERHILYLQKSALLELYGIEIEDIENSDILVVDNIEVKEPIELEGLNVPVVIFNSRFLSVSIGNHNDSFQTKINHRRHFHNTSIDHLACNNCYVKNLIIEGKSIIKEFISNNGIFELLNFWNSDFGSITVFNSKVKNSFKIENSQLGNFEIKENSEFNSIYLRSSEVKTNVSFNSIKINQLDFENSKIIGLWTNTSCAIHNMVMYGNSEFSLIRFSDNCKVNNISFENAIIGRLEIENGFDSQKVRIEKTEIREKVSIDGNTTIRELKLCSSFINDIAIQRSKINRINLEKSFTGNIVLFQTQIDSYIADQISKMGCLVFENCQVDFLRLIEHFGSITLSGTNIRLGHIDDCRINRFDISKSSDFEIYLKRCQINWLSFTHTSLNKNSLLSVSEGSIYFLEMDEFTVHGDLHFRKIDVQKGIYSPWWRNTKSLKQSYPKNFYPVIKNHRIDYIKSVCNLRVKIKPSLRISHSSLGRTEFTNCNLAGFRFEFNNSRITDCFISGGTIPSEKIVIIDDKVNELNQGDIETHSQKASIYNQFKKIFESQGDAYRSAQFQAKWAEHQKKYLELEYKSQKSKGNLSNPWERFSLIFGELSQDLGVFKLNEWSSKHGESWVQALGFTILTTGFFFTLFLWTIGRLYHIDEIGWYLFGYYFQFLTPTFKPDYITGYMPSPGSIAVYYIGKAAFAYGLYQFIAAFRKHGRKR